jgi:cell wall-associated NlpC family hydrolase
MSAGWRVAQAALGLVGCRFVLHGRDPAVGLDCVGLVAQALHGADAVVDVPLHYALRNKDAAQAFVVADGGGLQAVSGMARPGDILLLELGACQYHLVISLGAQGCVHAHAGLRRVVQSPVLPSGIVCGHWRIPAIS